MVFINTWILRSTPVGLKIRFHTIKIKRWEELEEKKIIIILHFVELKKLNMQNTNDAVNGVCS